MMTKESILQEIIEVATEALTSTKPISDDLHSINIIDGSRDFILGSRGIILTL